MFLDGKELLRNNFVQEKNGTIMSGFSKELKGVDAVPQLMENAFRRLSVPFEVDAHVYQIFRLL